MSGDLIPVEGCEKSRAGHGCHCDHWYEDLGCCWCVDGTVNLVVIGDDELPPPLTQEPNQFTPTPTGMCGAPKKCEHCPSDMLCWMKAQKEGAVIKARWDACRAAHPTEADR